jgi:hypothetical protein
MNIDEVIRNQVQKTEPSGSCVFPDMIRNIRSGCWSGIAVSKTEKGELYLLFTGGEPEGALLSDHRGVLVGDKAVLSIDPKSSYLLHHISPDIIDRLLLWCRIFDKSRITSWSSQEVVQIGKKPSGIGLLMIGVEKAGVPIPGANLTIRRVGAMVANNRTDHDGKASFRLMYGEYDCAVTLKDHQTRLYSFVFTPDHPRMVLEISDHDTVLPGS